MVVEEEEGLYLRIETRSRVAPVAGLLCGMAKLIPLTPEGQILCQKEGKEEERRTA